MITTTLTARTRARGVRCLADTGTRRVSPSLYAEEIAGLPRQVEFRPIPISSHFGDADGRLVLIDDTLFAVLSRLDASHYEESLRGRWFLEAGFGRLATNTPPTSVSLDEAADWVIGELARTEKARGRKTASE